MLYKWIFEKLLTIVDIAIGLFNGKKSLDNGFLNKYEINLKNRKKKLWICFSTYKFMVIQISLSFDSPSKTVKL
jgi:hypothetical protein